MQELLGHKDADTSGTMFFGNRTLATLRDALLPRLISGELRVKDAEKFLVGVKQ